MYFESPSKFNSKNYRSRNFSGVWQKHFINDYVDKYLKTGIESAIEEMAQHTDEHLPSHLYKFFRPSAFSLMNLDGNNLWLSSPKSFNDPFDSYICLEKQSFEKKFVLNELKKAKMITQHGSSQTFSLVESWKINAAYSRERSIHSMHRLSEKRYDDVLKQILSSKDESLKVFVDNTRMEARRVISKTLNAIRDVDVRITCFSNLIDDDDLSQQSTMWSHYAENHTGFCIKYSIKDAENWVKTGLLPVKYTSRVSTLSVTNMLKSHDSHQNFMENPIIAKAARKALITKSASWNYEKEWRLIVENERVDLLNNNCVSFPYAEAIYMGCRIEPNLELYLASLAERKGINIYKTVQNDEQFLLDIYPTSLNSIREKAAWNELAELHAKQENTAKNDMRIGRLYKKIRNL